MNNKINTIMWQKWVDPFGSDEEYTEILSDDNEPTFFEDNEQPEFEKNISTKNDIIKNIKDHIKVIATPMGIIPVNENTCSGKIFNFWVGHTNFDITKNIASIIEATEGVETLDIFTRYRFRISIGKAFSDSKVMRAINKNVYNYLE